MINQRHSFQKATGTLLAAFASLVFSQIAQAEEPTSCYRIEMPGTPISAPVDEAPTSEVWCYQKLAQPVGGLYIYNADQGIAKPELALIVEPDGMLTHGSLHAGKVTTHRTHASEFNPFSVPIVEPKQLSPVTSVPDNSLSQSAETVLRFLLSERAPYIGMAVEPGSFQVFLPAASQPWRGYWWPYRGLPINGPLAKYDNFVTGRTGSNPGATAWERRNHIYQGVSWHGHCNGWAAGAILRAEPRTSKRDATTGTVFTVSDQKGILSEKDYCANVSFYGSRYDGRAGDDIRDIYPANFHKTLTYYIGSVGKPVAVDYRRDPAVDTHIASGYTMNIQRTGTNTYSVTTNVKFHGYDISQSNSPGIAPSYTRTYRYTLTTTSSGAITGGRWISGNPDFIWVPLSIPNCTRSNPRVLNQWTDAILALPTM
jgi:hypothetical protein